MHTRKKIPIADLYFFREDWGPLDNFVCRQENLRPLICSYNLITIWFLQVGGVSIPGPSPPPPSPSKSAYWIFLIIYVKLSESAMKIHFQMEVRTNGNYEGWSKCNIFHGCDKSTFLNRRKATKARMPATYVGNTHVNS